ncbi:hypothetical protein ACFW9D_12550 [Streptomyces sp. NPDC059524]|uniref:hypothetical protein n=1 Tax=Streptomyces sp. NPDC059524 TaxID=3346856 RepID=UPI0036C8B431
MFVQLLAATGLLAALTMVPVPDTAVVTERALAAGRRDGLRTVRPDGGTGCAPWTASRPDCSSGAR